MYPTKYIFQGILNTEKSWPNPNPSPSLHGKGLLNADDHAENKAVVKVNVKKLSNVLTHNNLSLDRATLYLTDNEALVYNICLAPLSQHSIGTVTFYIPVIVGGGLEDNEDEDDS